MQKANWPMKNLFVAPMRSMNLKSVRIWEMPKMGNVSVRGCIHRMRVCVPVGWAAIHRNTMLRIIFLSSLLPSIAAFGAFFDLLQPDFPLKLSNRTTLKKQKRKSWPVLVKCVRTLEPYRKNCPRKSLSIIGPTALEVSMIDSPSVMIIMFHFGLTIAIKHILEFRIWHYNLKLNATPFPNPQSKARQMFSVL